MAYPKADWPMPLETRDAWPDETLLELQRDLDKWQPGTLTPAQQADLIRRAKEAVDQLREAADIMGAWGGTTVPERAREGHRRFVELEDENRRLRRIIEKSEVQR